MVRCFFVAYGVDFRVDSFLRESPLCPTSVVRKGEFTIDTHLFHYESELWVPTSYDQSESLLTQFGLAYEFLLKYVTQVGRVITPSTNPRANKIIAPQAENRSGHLNRALGRVC